MQTGNGSGVIGVDINGTMTDIGVKYSAPNGSSSILFFHPNYPPSTMATTAHTFTPGIPGSPVGVCNVRSKAKTLIGTSPTEHTQWETVEDL